MYYFRSLTDPEPVAAETRCFYRILKSHSLQSLSLPFHIRAKAYLPEPVSVSQGDRKDGKDSMLGLT